MAPGDFQEQATAVIEHLDGRLELIDLKAINARTDAFPEPAEGAEAVAI